MIELLILNRIVPASIYPLPTCKLHATLAPLAHAHATLSVSSGTETLIPQIRTLLVPCVHELECMQTNIDLPYTCLLHRC